MEQINWSDELMSQMFNTEQEAKRATIEQSRIWYTRAYQINKKLFDEQLEKVESLLKKSFEAGGDCFVDGIGELIRRNPDFEKWFNNIEK
jgi:hypothetical protein